MAKKPTTPKTGAKKKATPKAAQSDAGAKKTSQGAKKPPSGPKKGESAPPKHPRRHWPPFLKPLPSQYVVSTKDYALLIEDHNEKFKSAWNKFRLRPAVFVSIHETMVKYYNAIED